MNYTIDTFDWKYYIGEYEDLRNAGILTREKAWKHWMLYGSKENRQNRINTKVHDCFVSDEYGINKKNDNETFNLLTVWFDMDTTTTRFKEYLHVINLNLKNNNIKKIYLFFEYLENFNLDEILNKFDFFKNDKIIIIPKKKNYKRHISFNEMIEFSNKNLFGEKILISNNDIYFENLNKVKKDKLILKNMVLALTRTNVFDTAPTVDTMSQDSWIFVSPIKIPNDIVYIGWQGCDNRLAYELFNLGYNLSNPVDIIKCYHYQKINGNGEYKGFFTHQGDGLVMDVPFTELDQICETFLYKKDFFTRENDSTVSFILKLKMKMLKLLLYTNNEVIDELDYGNALKFDKYQEMLDYYNNSNEKIIILSDNVLNIKNNIVIQKEDTLLTVKINIIKTYKDIYLNYSNPYYKE